MWIVLACLGAAALVSLALWAIQRGEGASVVGSGMPSMRTTGKTDSPLVKRPLARNAPGRAASGPVNAGASATELRRLSNSHCVVSFGPMANDLRISP